MRTVLASTLLCFAISGCGNGGGAASGAVTGHAIDFYRLASAEVSQPNPHLSNMLAWAPQTDGTVTSLGVDLDGAGGFSIPDAPEGEYYLQDGDLWVVTSSRQLDLDDHTHQGRPAPIAIGESVGMTVNATGLIPRTGVLFEAVNPNQGILGTIIVFGQSPTESITSAPGSFVALTGGLPNGTAGDQTWVSERIDCAQMGAGGVGIVTLGGEGDDGGGGAIAACAADSNSCTLTDVAIDPNDAGSITLALAPIGPQNLAGTLDPAPYLRHLTDVHPLATADSVSLTVEVSPGTASLAAARVKVQAVPLVVFYTPPTAPLAFSQAYADPYPAEWTRTITWSYGFHIPTELPGATAGSGFNGAMTELRPLSALPSTLAPRLSPPLHFTIDGIPATTDSTLSRPNPRLQWSPPSLGTPKGYVGFVYRVIANTLLLRTEVLSFVTADTHFQLPQNVLGPGTYLFDVFAWDGPALDFVNAPYRYRSAVDASLADTLSGIWTLP